MSIYERDLTTGKLKVISGKPTIFTGATDSTDGTAGNVPAPIAGDEDKFLTGGGIWTPDTANLTTTYTTEDDDTTTAIITSAGGETAISTMESGAKHSRLFNKVSRVALNMRKLINTVKRVWNSVGATWVSGHAYAANDMVVYENGHVYKCILAHTSSSSILPTNTTYWVDTTLAAEIASLNSKLQWTQLTNLPSMTFKTVTDGATNINGFTQDVANRLKNRNEVLVLLGGHTGRADTAYHFIYPDTANLTGDYWQTYGGTWYSDSTYQESISMMLNFYTGELRGGYRVSGWNFPAPTIKTIYVK